MSFWRLYYHIVWSTKNRAELITPELETELYGYLKGKADSHGVIVQAIGGIEDHVHLVASIPPRIAIANFVGKIKGSSSHHIKCTFPKLDHEFNWQRGYGVLSLGQSRLPKAINYTLNQKENHHNHTTIPILEKETEEDEGPKEDPA